MVLRRSWFRCRLRCLTTTFFGASTSRAELDSASGAEWIAERPDFSAPARVQQEEVRSVTEDVFPVEASVGCRLLGRYGRRWIMLNRTNWTFRPSAAGKLMNLLLFG